MFPWALSFYRRISSQSSLLLTPTATTSSWAPWISARVSWPVTPSGSSQPCPKVTSRQSPVAPRALPQSGTQDLSRDISSLSSCSAPGSWSSELPEPIRPYCFLPQCLCTGGDGGSLSSPSSSSVLSPPRSAPARRDRVTLCMVIFMCVCWRRSWGSWGRACNKNRTTVV